METLHKYYQKIPRILKNKYAITLIFFLVWMFFFDANTFYGQFKLSNQLEYMRDRKVYYQKEVQAATTAIDELLTNEETQEKFARENYYMKKSGEDVFVITEE